MASYWVPRFEPATSISVTLVAPSTRSPDILSSPGELPARKVPLFVNVDAAIVPTPPMVAPSGLVKGLPAWLNVAPPNKAIVPWLTRLPTFTLVVAPLMVIVPWFTRLSPLFASPPDVSYRRVMPGPMVPVAPPSERRLALLPVPVRTTVPAPARVCAPPLKLNAVKAPVVELMVKVRPASTVSPPVVLNWVLLTDKSMSSVTPLVRVLRLLLPALMASAPVPDCCNVPPLIAPLMRLTTPLGESNTKVLPALFMVPVRFSVPAVPPPPRVMLANCDEAKVPSRLSTPPLSAMLPPVLFQLVPPTV